MTLVLDAIGKAHRLGQPVDPAAIGRQAAAKIRETTEFVAKGGILGALGLLRPDVRTIDRVRTDIAEARRPLRDGPDPANSCSGSRTRRGIGHIDNGDRALPALWQVFARDYPI